ncbi:hypothetical protein TanjilG_12549 [Lupinus angustifolius]|uniref:F-box domain-containing protein n=1 Tax=Lupinus angustifolius TaxID=3871 RepID=A0A4P1QZ52_LUPAN|nr:PREDICTED: F-box/LRR-repeat protein 25-like [Lupinus angustifolius]XP_019414942.1 PREDICTED: F-box/LRR-repeat protein 25-like [Lupinus angustifolius]OIV97792.1 hypothetical protein TanjilG_12549 [Lupinus angustifolius]
MVRGKQIKSEREEKKDKLSDMPDCVLYHILSFVNFNEVVQTSILSKRWEHIWKSVPTILLYCTQAMTILDFKNFRIFMSKILSLRDKKAALKTIDFKHHGGYVKASLLGKLISDAISHNVQQLSIYAETDINQLPPTILSPIFSSQTITSVKVSVYHKNKSGGRIMFPKSAINVPSLTRLYLVNIEFCASGDEQVDPFSNMNRLSDLFIKYCTLEGAKTLHISSPTLSNLTIHSRDSSINEIVLSTRNLSSFTFEGVPLLTLSGNGLAYVEQVYIDAYTMDDYSLEPPLMLLKWLQKFAHVQSLTVTANTLQVVSLIPDLMDMDHLSMGNLKSLIVKMKKDSSPIVPDGVMKFLLQNSPWAKVSITKHTS